MEIDFPWQGGHWRKGVAIFLILSKLTVETPKKENKCKNRKIENFII